MYMTVCSTDILHTSGSSHDGRWRSVDEVFTPLLTFYEVELKRENEFIYLLKSMKISKINSKFHYKANVYIIMTIIRRENGVRTNSE